MLRIFKRNKDKQSKPETQENSPLPPEKAKEKVGSLNRLRQGLSKTRHQLSEGLAQLVLGKKTIDANLLEDIETQLLLADMGIETTQAIIGTVTEKLKRHQLSDPAVLMSLLREEMEAILTPVMQPWVPLPSEHPAVVLVIGVNGSGKTTTIGKLAHYFQAQHKQVMLAAGDTFRAAAIEQLAAWGQRNEIPVIAQQSGADSASVIFDALQSARAKAFDILIADTAGRLHTQQNLMEELKKIKRVLTKLDPSAPHEVLLVLDAGIGQNALVQAKQFHQAIGVTGLVLTKLDGTAKGGIIFSIAKTLGLPIRFIGIGEQIDDLRPFSAHDFVSALFNEDQEG